MLRPLRDMIVLNYKDMVSYVGKNTLTEDILLVGKVKWVSYSYFHEVYL